MRDQDIPVPNTAATQMQPVRAGAVARRFHAIAAATEIPFRVVFADGTFVAHRDGRPRLHDHVPGTEGRAPRASVRARGPPRILFRRQPRRRRRPRTRVSRRVRRRLRPGHVPFGRTAQPLARVALLEPLDRAGEGQCSLPLRPRAGLLPPVARHAGHDVHVCLLARGHDLARGGAAQQDGPRLPQGAARRRRDVRRHRFRLGRTAVPRMGTLRRARHRDQHHDRAGGGNASRDRAPRACGQGACAGVRLPRDPRPVRQAVVDRHARARGPRSVAGGGPRPCRCVEAGRARGDPLHRPRRRARHRVLHPQAHLSRRLDSQPLRRHSTGWSAAASKCSTSRICAGTTR